MSGLESWNQCALCYDLLVEEGGGDAGRSGGGAYLWRYHHLGKYFEGGGRRDVEGLNSVGVFSVPSLSYQMVTSQGNNNGVSEGCGGDNGGDVGRNQGLFKQGPANLPPRLKNRLQNLSFEMGNDKNVPETAKRICGGCEEQLQGLMKLEGELKKVKRRIEDKVDLLKVRGGGNERMEEVWRDNKKKAREQVEIVSGVSTGLQNVRQTLKFLEGLCVENVNETEKPVNNAENHSQGLVAQSISPGIAYWKRGQPIGLPAGEEGTSGSTTKLVAKNADQVFTSSPEASSSDDNLPPLIFLQSSMKKYGVEKEPSGIAGAVCGPVESTPITVISTESSQESKVMVDGEPVRSVKQEKNTPEKDLKTDTANNGGTEDSHASVSKDNQDTEEPINKRIKYNKDFLLRIGSQTDSIPVFKTAECGLPDLARQNNFGDISVVKSHVLGRGIRRGMGINLSPAPPPNRPAHVPLMTMQFPRTREIVKLHKADSPWKRSSPENQDIDEDQRVIKKARGILNKLTPANFDALVAQFLELPMDNKDQRISAIIRMIFKKAVMEPFYLTAYVRMVHALCNRNLDTAKMFRKSVLDQCQIEFKESSGDEDNVKALELQLAAAYLQDDKTRHRLKLEFEEKRYLARQRSLGNVTFVGELFKLQMLSPRMMVELVRVLLIAPNEEKLECLCKLLTIVGLSLDVQLMDLEEAVARGEKAKFVPEPKWMNRIFLCLKGLSEDRRFSARIRFAVMDVVELRDNLWKRKRDASPDSKKMLLHIRY